MKMMPLRIDAKQLKKLQRIQQNAWGRPLLDDILVDVTYNDGAKVTVELQIEPNIILRGKRWWAGVAYNPGYYENQFGAAEDVGEWIAYGINEGAVTEDTQNDDDDKPIRWKVQKSSVTKLRKWGVLL